jgi:hypothetical protein
LSTGISRAAAAAVFHALAMVVLGSQPAAAHHGWSWATDEEFEITGTFVSVRLGNPHGEMVIDVDGTKWTVEIGQPYRNHRAGLTEDKLAVGVEVTVHGHRADDGQPLLKAENVVIDGVAHVLYPNRRRAGN